MLDEKSLIKIFKDELIKELKEETEKEIQLRVKEFEQHLRELTMSKITNYADKLKIFVKQQIAFDETSIIIQVKL